MISRLASSLHLTAFISKIIAVSRPFEFLHRVRNKSRETQRLSVSGPNRTHRQIPQSENLTCQDSAQMSWTCIKCQWMPTFFNCEEWTAAIAV
jgi:hypothetical protein